MGVSFTIVLYAPDASTANRCFRAGFDRIEQLNRIFSDYDSTSEIGRLGSASPTKEPVRVSDDLWRVLRDAQALAERSGGAFDVTVGPLTKLWRRAQRRKEVPSPARLAEALAAVGTEHLRLDPQGQTVELMRPGMRLDLGGIAKGYAADAALAEIRQRGVRRALVNASGDIALGDPPPDKPGWTIGVAPLDARAPPSRKLLLANCGIATSGDAWQSVEIGGRRYSHILDPHTGLGLTQRSSVTVVASDCMTADGLASAVSVLGPVKGLALIEGTCAAEALIVVASDGKPKSYQSRGFGNRMGSPE